MPYDVKLNLDDEHSCVMTISEFIDCCRVSAFTDDDGYGYPVRDNLVDRTTLISPSDLTRIPKDATHIDWINA